MQSAYFKLHREGTLERGEGKKYISTRERERERERVRVGKERFSMLFFLLAMKDAIPEIMSLILFISRSYESYGKLN